MVFLSLKDPGNKANWSGLNYFIYKAAAEVSPNIRAEYGFRAKHTLWIKIRNKLSRIFGYNFYYDLTTPFCRQYGAQINKHLKDISPQEVIFTLNSQLIPYLRLHNKIILYNDATLANLYGYYDYFSNLSPWERKQAFANERRSLKRADLLFFASDWAAHSAIRDFGADPAKVHVLPFGANLESVPSSGEISELIGQRTLRPIRLLWVGVDYERKGGDLAMQVAAILNQQGFETILTMAGVENLPGENLPGFVINAGRIDKQSTNGEARLAELYRQADLFILPSHRECYGVVYAEACAFGLPIIAIQTGGVPTIVHQEENGWLFSEKAKAGDYAQKIVEWVTDHKVYVKLALGARQAYDERLNWDLVSRRMHEIIWH